MKLKPNIDPAALLRTVKKCGGEVWYDTEEGDHLNLKSALSQLLFAAAQTQMTAENGKLICQDAPDYEYLRDYLTD